MTTPRQIFVLLATMTWCVGNVCVPAFAQVNAVADDKGVVVNLNGGQVNHRSPVLYPAERMAKGVTGTVVIEVRLDANGGVIEATVLSGPDELGASARESVTGWHFDGCAGGATRQVKIDFGTPAETAVTFWRTTTEVGISDAPPQPTAPQTGTIDQIDVTGLSEAVAAELLEGFPVHPGDRLVGDVLTRAKDAASRFDSHLMVELNRGMLAENVLRIRPKETPAGPMLIKGERPVYPPLAKMAKQRGVVRFEATVGKDGTVEDLKLISGPPLLVSVAKDAVAKWIYQPVFLNGVPVRMMTTVIVAFESAKDGLAARSQ